MGLIKVTVQVTQEHLDRSWSDTERGDPAALAIRELLAEDKRPGSFVSVGSNGEVYRSDYLWIGDDAGWTLDKIWPPRGLEEHLRALVALPREKRKPFSFKIDLLEETMR